MLEGMIQGLDRQLLELLERGPVTPDEVAAELGVAWATAQGHLLRLQAAGKAFASRKGRVNVYFLRAAGPIRFQAPAWAKVRSLEALADELQAHFPASVSAAAIIAKERRRA
jgi:predicted ArsR family transcriptional regulator